MDRGETLMTCHFDKLFTRSVPHILEKIFFSLDYESYKKCLKVSNVWTELLTSESYQRRGKSVFHRDILMDWKDILMDWKQELTKELHDALKKDNIIEIKRLVTTGMVDVNCKWGWAGDKKTPLFVAVRQSNKDVVHLLLKKGADTTEVVNYMGKTVLHEAAWNGNDSLVKILLDFGADPKRADNHGRTPLYYAVRCGHKEVVEVLMDGGADPNKPDNYLDNPLFRAVSFGHKDVAQLLLNKGADPERVNGYGLTPLHKAAWNGHNDLVRVLLDFGANPNRADNQGGTPLNYAARNGHKEVVEDLMKAGAEPNSNKILMRLKK